MKPGGMKKPAVLLSFFFFMLSCATDRQSEQTSNIGGEVIQSVIDELGPDGSGRLEKGVRQCAFLWRESDGDEEAFKQFVHENYVSDSIGRKALYDKLSSVFDRIYGCYGELAADLQRPVVLKGPDPTSVDYIMAAYNPYGHVSDDFFANKLAFVTILNFPNYTLAQKNEEGKDWSRLEWAYARMGDMFSTRIPASVTQAETDALAACENYIASYNIMMGHILTEDGRRIFPDDMVLLSHWNLRDELKSDYADVPDAREKQEMIYRIMERIVGQEIPAAVVNCADYDWAPYSNRTWKDGQEVTLDAEGDVRYGHILDMFHALRMADPYCPAQPTAIVRNFEGGMEVPAEEIEKLFVGLISSEQVTKVGKLISGRLGRELRPYDIWYDGFKNRSSIPEDLLTKKTRALYPTPDAFQKAMPGMLRKLGFTKEYSEYIADKIGVEAARGSGHALGSCGKGYKSYLRTRIGEKGMDYKGYNIAVHEFGHNVEQTIDLYDIDYYTLSGVPNTGFTEALAFIFQKRDLHLLGYEMDGNSDMVLDMFWGMYEIMGVSLVDMYTWRWLYDNPDATAAQLRDNCVRIAREVWNKYYEPVLGTHDSAILAVYSHMVNSPMYLPNYPFGSIVEYQIENHFANLSDPDLIGPEIERIWKTGRLTPQAWMHFAVNAGISIEPVLAAVDEALKKHAQSI